MLNSPAKQAGRRKSIVEQLEGDDEEVFAPNSPSDRNSVALKRNDNEENTVLKLRSKPSKPRTFTERLRDAANDEEEELADS